MTHWSLADGTGVEIVNFLDDHSRYCVASVAVPVTRAIDVAEIFTTAIERTAHPLRCSPTTDASTPPNIRRESRHGNPHRSARHHLQTLQPLPPANLREDRTVPTKPKRSSSPNNPPPRHSSSCKPTSTGSSPTTTSSARIRTLGRRTPHEAFNARLKAHPGTSIPAIHFRVRTTKSTSTVDSPSATSPSSTTSAWEPATAANKSSCSSPAATSES